LLIWPTQRWLDWKFGACLFPLIVCSKHAVDFYLPGITAGPPIPVIGMRFTIQKHCSTPTQVRSSVSDMPLEGLDRTIICGTGLLCGPMPPNKIRHSGEWQSTTLGTEGPFDRWALKYQKNENLSCLRSSVLKAAPSQPKT